MLTRRDAIALPAFLLAAGVLAGSAGAGELPVFSTGGTAINGYDPVAYHSEGRPVPGSAGITARWNGALWRFASAANRDAFVADPERFAPAFGGYCAWAVSQGSTAPTDPSAWEIVEGTLYLNYSQDVREKWRQDRAANIAAGERNWPGVLD